jgi:acyl dehydratase
MSEHMQQPLEWTSIRVGDEIPPLDVPLTASVIVAGAIASRDFMPVHHDRAYANKQGAPDIFMNILTTNGYVARFVTDWAGPHAQLKSIAIRLGAPAMPGFLLRFTGVVQRTERQGDLGLVDVALRGTTDIGDHVTGNVVLLLPASDAAARP